MSRQVPIKAGSKIKIPAFLLEQYESEWKLANEILKEKRKASRKPSVRQGDNRYSITFRRSDISLFQRRRDVLKYIKTTHDIVTGKYFQKQISQYRGNLLRSALKNFGVPIQMKTIQGQFREENISAFNINQYSDCLSQTQKDILVTLATMTKEEIAELERSSDVNLVQYVYLPEQYQQEHEETLIESINAVYEKLYGEKNAFSGIQEYRRKRGL